MMAGKAKQIHFLPGERGQSMVELAFSVVLLLLLAAGAMDLGRAFFAYMALRDASQEGAIFAAICPNDATRIIDRVRNSSQHPVDLTDTSHVAVACFRQTSSGEQSCTAEGEPGNYVRVRVTWDDFRITTPFLGAAVGGQTFTLWAETKDTILRKECIP